MKTTQALTIGVATWLLAGSTAFADVQVTMQNGRVSLVAKDATLRQILTEWARVGQTKIVNVERIPGGPMSLELNNMPEAQALDVLLRTLSGYMAAPRPVPSANLSRFDRIIVIPTSAAPRAAAASAPPTAPTFQQQPQFNPPPQPADDDGDDQRPAPNGQVPNQNRGPVFNTFPQPMVVNPQGVPTGMPGVAGGMPQGGAPVPQPTPQPAAYPTAPFGGVAVPGMVAPPPPPPPGQPGQPGVAGPPVRRPGGLGGQ